MNLPYEIAAHLLWIIFRKAFQFIRFFVWSYKGIYSRIKQNHSEDAYKGSTQILNILARHKFCLMLQPPGKDNFLMTHKEFVDPEYVLQDHISLYNINKDEAVFVEAVGGIDVTESKHGAFVCIAQFKLAQKFIVMPINAFHKLAEKVGATEAKIIFLCNTARCGSTLMTQVFEETGSSIAYSEPYAINSLLLLKDVVSQEERIKIFKHCINILCKPYHMKEIQFYVLKLMASAMQVMPLIVELFPECPVLFMYRDGLKSSKSLAKLCKEQPMSSLALLVGRISVKLTTKVIEGTGFPANNYDTQFTSAIGYSAITWVTCTRSYLDFRENGMKIVGIRYEDLVHNTKHAFQKVFEYCGLPYDAQAVEVAMGRDSQRGTPGSRERLAKHKDEEFTDEVKRETDRLCDKFRLPSFSEPFIFPGTITFREN